MRRSEKFANPFYILLVIAGITFAITAMLYGVMATRANASFRASNEAGEVRQHALMAWMEAHGDATLLSELGILAACTFGAIGTDDFWQRRAAAARKMAGEGQSRRTRG